MLEALLELVITFFGELLLQLLTEWIGAGFRAGWYKLRGRPGDTTVLREAAWSVLGGAVAGAVTLVFFPSLVIRSPALQMLNLVLAPLAAGLLVERVRAWRESRPAFRFPVFAYAALFGLTFALVRFLFAH